MAYGFPTRVISGNDILELNGDQQVIIGHTLEYCLNLEETLKEAIEKAETYYNRLIELGDIKKPKTTEDLMEEQKEVNQNLLSIIQKLSKKIDRLEHSEVNNGLNEISVIDCEGNQPRTNKKSRKGIE